MDLPKRKNGIYLEGKAIQFTIYKKLTKKVRKFSLKGKAEAELRLRAQKYFFSTEFLRIYSVCVKNTTYIVITKLSTLYIVV